MKNSNELQLQRRHFLKASAAFGGASILGAMPFRAFAQATSLAPADRCFVFVYFSGGWDVLLSPLLRFVDGANRPNKTYVRRRRME